jgi:hypothetical protein
MSADDRSLMPLASLCEGCANDPFWCGYYRPRMVSDDAMPREACKGHEEKQHGGEVKSAF